MDENSVDKRTAFAFKRFLFSTASRWVRRSSLPYKNRFSVIVFQKIINSIHTNRANSFFDEAILTTTKTPTEIVLHDFTMCSSSRFMEFGSDSRTLRSKLVDENVFQAGHGNQPDGEYFGWQCSPAQLNVARPGGNHAQRLWRALNPLAP